MCGKAELTSKVLTLLLTLARAKARALSCSKTTTFKAKMSKLFKSPPWKIKTNDC